MTELICSTCGGERIGIRQGSNQCLACRNATSRRGRLANPELHRAKAAQWRDRNPETNRACQQAYRDTHREEKRVANAIQYARNKRRREWAALCAQLDAVRTPEILDFRGRVTEMRRLGVAEMRLPNVYYMAFLDTDLRVLRIREEKASRFGVEWWDRFRVLEAEFEPIPALPPKAAPWDAHAGERRAA